MIGRINQFPVTLYQVLAREKKPKLPTIFFYLKKNYKVYERITYINVIKSDLIL